MELSWKVLLLFSLAAFVLAEELEDQGIPDSGIGDDEEDQEEEIKLDREESRNLHPRAYQTTSYVPNTVPTGFRPSQEIPEHAVRRPIQPVPEESFVNLVPARPQNYDQGGQHIRVPHRKQQEQQQRLIKKEELEELEEEKEEPDRLSLLLQSSKFDCSSMQTGYYADEELACEVFHYCHDSVKHSWICPNGFTFHQVHLICMPPSNDNICQKSSKYHFVNEYLYRPINLEESQRKPNVTLRYSDRYFPSDIYHDDRYEDDEEERESTRPVSHHQQQQQQQQQHQLSRNQQHHQTHQPQVFRNSEEINIPLLQRRPSIPNYPSPRPNTYTTPAEFEYQ